MPPRKKSSSKKAPSPSYTFEEALHELEQITESLEHETLDLESLVKAFERGEELLNFCQKSLTSARESIELVEANKVKPPKTKKKIPASADSATTDDDVRLF